MNESIAASIPHPHVIRARIRELNRELALARQLFAIAVISRSQPINASAAAPTEAVRADIADARKAVPDAG